MSTDALFNLITGTEIIAFVWLMASVTKEYKDPMEISMSALANLFLTFILLFIW